MKIDFDTINTPLSPLFTTIVRIGLLLVLLIIIATAVTGCATPGEDARTLMDRLEFDDDEYGSFELEGTVDVNPVPFFSTNMHLKLVKNKDKPVTE
tara:strand:- start:3724 stop:4011 length:288 start_codon:yes stop_codon:yes gene_type:complete